MKHRKVVTYLLAFLILLSTIYHSDSSYSIFASVPLLSVSYSVHQGKKRFIFPSLIFTTFISLYFISADTMNEFVSLFIFMISFAVPLFMFWLITLIEKSNIRLKPLGTSLSFLFITVAIFYLIPVSLGISDFIITPDNRGPQILLFLGSGMAVAVPYHLILEVKD